VRLACSLLLSLLGVSASTPRLSVDVVVTSATVPPHVKAWAIEEAARIWSPYGVDIRPSNAEDAGRDGAVRLGITFADRQTGREPTGMLGSIVFHGDSPEPAIVLYPAAVSELVATAALLRFESQRPAEYRDRVLARVLGRALAHEVGHFLLRWKGHSSAGLMRAHQVTPDLTAPERRYFILSADEVKRLDSVISTLFQLSAQ